MTCHVVNPDFSGKEKSRGVVRSAHPMTTTPKELVDDNARRLTRPFTACQSPGCHFVPGGLPA
jgi:hypothetical protein